MATTSPVVTPTLTLSGKVITPAPALTATTEESPAVATTAEMPPDSAGKAVVADWEEMFRATNSYEYVMANGRPRDKSWWIEQAQRFYTGKALTDELQRIEFMFSPRSLGQAFAFIENARYTVQVQSCSSATECTLQVNLQSGKFWAYDAHYKKWSESNPAQASDWTVTLQFDPAAGHWKIK